MFKTLKTFQFTEFQMLHLSFRYRCSAKACNLQQSDIDHNGFCVCVRNMYSWLLGHISMSYLIILAKLHKVCNLSHKL